MKLHLEVRVVMHVETIHSIVMKREHHQEFMIKARH